MAAKKLQKKVDGNVVTINAIEGAKGEMTFDFLSLPTEIQAKLGPFGLGHKLGDAAAGKTGADAEEAITKVWEGLMANDWTTRAPAAPKVSTKTITDNLGTLSSEEQLAAIAILQKLGLKIPGITTPEPVEE